MGRPLGILWRRAKLVSIFWISSDEFSPAFEKSFAWANLRHGDGVKVEVAEEGVGFYAVPLGTALIFTDSPYTDSKWVH